MYNDLYKYPRTAHIPGSPGATNDDKIADNLDTLIGKPIVFSIKMDGENTNMYSHHIHARSLDSEDDESKHWVKGLWGRIKHDIPEYWRICGENLYAKHSIYYEDLETYFYVFSIWDDFNMILNYHATLEWCNLLGLVHVPTFHECIYSPEVIDYWVKNFHKKYPQHEGFVVRNAGTFHYEKFSENVFKYVRKNHVTTTSHWKYEKIIPNRLRH